MTINELAELSDSELLNLMFSARHQRKEAQRSKTNRFGTFKKLPKRELDSLIKRFQLLADDIKELETRCGFENQEILKQVLGLSTSDVQIL